jgi:PAS domain S-box-containing protein
LAFEASLATFTDRKKFEEALRDSESRYKLLFESTPQPIWVYNEEHWLFWPVNEAATKTYGYSRDEFLSMTGRLYSRERRHSCPTDQKHHWRR